MSSSNKKQKFYHNKYKGNTRNGIEAGQRGFLATCNFRAKDCVRECYNILNHYADELYGETEVVQENAVSSENDDNIDIADELENEIAALKAANDKNQTAKVQRRFQSVNTGIQNCVFINTTLLNPVELGYHIVKDISETRKQRSRFLLRLVPIEIVCRANVKDIMEQAGLLFDKHFLKQGYSFAIAFSHRYNNDIKRDVIIEEMASLIQSKNNANRVNLKTPEKTVVVEVMKGICCLGVVDNYFEYKKYNLIELANVKESEEKATDSGVDAENNKNGNNEGQEIELDESDDSKLIEKTAENQQEN